VNVSSGFGWVGCNCPSSAVSAVVGDGGDDDGGGCVATTTRRSMNGDEGVLDVPVQWPTSTLLCGRDLATRRTRETETGWTTGQAQCVAAIRAGGKLISAKCLGAERQ